MTEPNSPQVAVMCRTWGDQNSDESFAMRGLAGALSRHATVRVVVPGRPELRVADGLFDLHGIGAGTEPDSWPSPDGAAWPTVVDAGIDLVVVSSKDSAAQALVSRFLPSATVARLVPPDQDLKATTGPHRWTAGGCIPNREIPKTAEWIGLSVPVNALASSVRHNGLGFTDFLLVLTDRPVTQPFPVPPAEVAWITARFPTQSVVFVEGAQAIVWRGRAHRGTIAVDTRTDLWRLIAHARVTIDLRPGDMVGRECVESLRYGTPVIAPHDSIGALLVDSGGCTTYRSIRGLLDAVEMVSNATIRTTMSRRGREAADRDFGNPAAFVDRVGFVLADALHAP